jgi:hypothetical protein
VRTRVVVPSTLYLKDYLVAVTGGKAVRYPGGVEIYADPTSTKVTVDIKPRA